MATRSRARREIEEPGSTIVTLEQLLDERPFLTERKIRQLVAQRKIPYFKPGRRLLFDLVDVDEWVSRSRVNPVA